MLLQVEPVIEEVVAVEEEVPLCQPEDLQIDMELKLHSPVGGECIIYRWPLVIGDERDESLEIIETIKWVCDEVPNLKKVLEKNEVFTMYNARNYHSMKDVCDRYNRAVDSFRHLKWTVAASPTQNLQFASTGLLKHILQVSYNRAVEDPDKLNQYEPFSPEVYGETSFELVEELTKVTNFGEDDIFIDLGSGVGQVVLQIAGSTPCKFCYGIEKADWPARYSESLSSEFKKWMSFFGKYHSMFRLEKGDFLRDDKLDAINSASIIFVNNFAFGPHVDHQLKLRFANVKEGARIVSSRAFCPLNFHITDRNLSDIGTIMKVEELSALPAAVSWTDKPFAYYLHTIDRSQLENYFNKLKNNSDTGSKRYSGSERTKRRYNCNNSNNGDSVKSDSSDDVVNKKKPRKQFYGETTDSTTCAEVANGLTKKLYSNGYEKRKYKVKLKRGPKKTLPLKRGRGKLNSSTMDTLDLLHQQISSGSASSDKYETCEIFNDRRMNQGRDSLTQTNQLNVTSLAVNNLMGIFERQMMSFLKYMEGPSYRDQIVKEIRFEQQKNACLKLEKLNLERELEELQKLGVNDVNNKILEIGLPVTNVPDLLQKAAVVLKEHKKLERHAAMLKGQISQLEQDNKQLVALQHSWQNGNVPTLHDLLTAPLDISGKCNIKIEKVSNPNDRNGIFLNRNVGNGNLLSEVAEMLVKKNLRSEPVVSGTPRLESIITEKKKGKRGRPCKDETSAKSKKFKRSNINKEVTIVPSCDNSILISDCNNNTGNKNMSLFKFPTQQQWQLPEHAGKLQQQQPWFVPSNISELVLPSFDRRLAKLPQHKSLQIQNTDGHECSLLYTRDHNLENQASINSLQRQDKSGQHGTVHLKKHCKSVTIKQHQVAEEALRSNSSKAAMILPPSGRVNNAGSSSNHTISKGKYAVFSQAPFLSKLAAPNFAVVDFGQLIKATNLSQSLANVTSLSLSLPPSKNVQSAVASLSTQPCFSSTLLSSSFLSPVSPPVSTSSFSTSHFGPTFPYSSFMFFKPSVGPTGFVSSLSKPLFSQPSSVPPMFSSSSSSLASVSSLSLVSFSSPLLSLPLFQPANLLSASSSSKSSLLPTYSSSSPSPVLLLSASSSFLLANSSAKTSIASTAKQHSVCLSSSSQPSPTPSLMSDSVQDANMALRSSPDSGVSLSNRSQVDSENGIRSFQNVDMLLDMKLQHVPSSLPSPSSLSSSSSLRGNPGCEDGEDIPA